MQLYEVHYCTKMVAFWLEAVVLLLWDPIEQLNNNDSSINEGYEVGLSRYFRPLKAYIM
jgi:hypothetical protein